MTPELSEALNPALVDGLPTDSQLNTAAKEWKKAVDSPYRMFADRDFLAGAVWGIKLVTTGKP
jgi:hypothetical protein